MAVMRRGHDSRRHPTPIAMAFLNGTGAYGAANGRGGVDAIDLWIGGLAEKRPEFGSAMLGTTFNYVFEFQMEHCSSAIGCTTCRARRE